MGKKRKAEWLKENAWTIVSIVVIGALILWWVVASLPPKVSTIPTPYSGDCYSAEHATEHKNEDGCVDFSVGYTYESSAGNKFIDQYEDYKSGFIVYIPSSTTASKLDLNQFNGKDIRVSGQISDYYGSTEIVVTDVSQIKIYE